MKNNFYLIIVVTLLSVVVIGAVILLNSGGNKDESSGGSLYISVSESASSSLPQDESESGTPPPPESSAPAPPETSGATKPPPAMTEEVARVIATANSLIGTSFVENGETPAGFDNSGFIYYVLKAGGYITCPRSLAQQAQMGTQLAYSEIKEGDLVFFYNEEKTAPGFGGIYIGGGRMIACLSSGDCVKEIDITSNYYQSNFCCGVSLS